MTSAPAGRIDLNTLSSVLGVMSRNPAWPRVEASIERLRTAPTGVEGTGDHDLRRAAQTIREFAMLLERSTDTIAKALLCGAMVGKVVDRVSAGDRMLLGLNAISSAFRFSHKDDANVAAALTTLAKGMRERFPELPRVPDSLGPVTDVTTAKRWRDAVEQLLTLVGRTPSLGPRTIESLELRRAAWESARRRMDRFLSGGPTEEPSLEEILLAAVGASPADLLPFDPAEFSVENWSVVLWDVLVRDAPSSNVLSCPTWVAAAALRALGWQIHRDLVPWLSAHFRNASDDEDPVFTANVPESWLSAPSATRSVIIVTTPGGVTAPDTSLANSWKPSRRTAALALDHRTIEEILEASRKRPESHPPLAPAPAVVAFEMPLASPDADVRLLETARRLLAGLDHVPPTIYLYTDAATDPSQGPMKHPYIIAPREVDAIIAPLAD